MSDATTVVMADDHPTFLLGLREVIGRDSAFEVVGEAGDGGTAMDVIAKHKPDIAIVDWDMPEMNGLDVMREIRKRGLSTRLIILTMHSEESLFNAAMDVGVSGFVLKDRAVEDILRGLRTVRDGDVFLSPAVSRYLLRRSRRVADLHQEKPGLNELTPTERKVLKRIAANETTREIAKALFVSPRTVETHRRNMCLKLDLHGSHRLLQFALQHSDEL